MAMVFIMIPNAHKLLLTSKGHTLGGEVVQSFPCSGDVGVKRDGCVQKLVVLALRRLECLIKQLVFSEEHHHAIIPAATSQLIHTGSWGD